jgi:hypothetical protein
MKTASNPNAVNALLDDPTVQKKWNDRQKLESNPQQATSPTSETRFIHLLRNSCHSTLLRSELKAKSGGLFVEAADEVVLVFFFVVTLAGVAVLDLRAKLAK